MSGLWKIRSKEYFDTLIKTRKSSKICILIISKCTKGLQKGQQLKAKFDLEKWAQSPLIFLIIGVAI